METKTRPPKEWAISRLRALETGRWVPVASTNGISGVVDAAGHVVERADVKRPQTIVEEVQLAQGTTPATRRRLAEVFGAAEADLYW